MKLIFDDVWAELASHWQAEPRFICVPYYFCDEGTQLTKGDILIVNASDEAIRSGQTNAAALERAFRNGARIASHPDLHAKIYVLGADVFVGSANASLSARRILIECLTHFTDSHALGKAISFITSLADVADNVNEGFIDRIKQLPVARGPEPQQRRGAQVDLSRQQCSWLIGLHDIDFPGDIEPHNEASMEIQGLLGRDHAVDWFWYPKCSALLYREAAKGDVFIEIWRSKAGRTGHGVEVFPPKVIHKIETDSDGRKVFHFSSARRSVLRPLTWVEFKALMNGAHWNINPTVGGSRLIPERHARELERLWPRRR